MDIPLNPPKIDHNKNYKRICQAGIKFFSCVYNFKPFNNLVIACHRLYLKNEGYDDKEIKFILMIHAAIMRGTVRKELRKCERQYER